MASDDRPTINGVQFAAVDGQRSSQAAGRAVFADSVREVDESVADRVMHVKDWRKGYMGPVRDIVKTGARSAKDALRIAADGLASVKRNLTFVGDGVGVQLDEAIATPSEPAFETVEIEGRGAGSRELEVPYRGRMLRGDDLLRQLDGWVGAGVMETSCAEALRSVVANPAWLDMSDQRFVLLGAASEMGPFIPLSNWRAQIVAVDLPRRSLWEQILQTGRAGSGRLSVPTSPTSTSAEVVDSAGADLMVDAPRVRAWLDTFDGPLILGNYVYADGANFVRLAAIVDALVQDTLQKRSDVTSAYLATPTDVFAVPQDVVDDAVGGAKRRPHHGLLKGLTASRLYMPNYSESVEGEGRRWGLADGLVPIQGANYALAKSIQRWRAVLAREEGHASSANVAPASHTRSVTKNKMLAAAYRGAPRFGVEIFAAETTRVLMAALLVHDIRSPQAAARPQTSIDHPYDLFVQGALHGGMWRLPYEPRSILPLALVTGSLPGSKR